LAGVSLPENGNRVGFWNVVLFRKLDDVQKKNKIESDNCTMVCPSLSTHIAIW
jgi:hypothetical protein